MDDQIFFKSNCFTGCFKFNQSCFYNVFERKTKKMIVEYQNYDTARIELRKCFNLFKNFKIVAVQKVFFFKISLKNNMFYFELETFSYSDNNLYYF